MFFLLRCVFWLGLLFSQIADREGQSLTHLAQPAAQQAQAGAARVAQAAADQCRAQPAACLAAAAKLSEAGRRLTNENAAPSQDSLRDEDRAPAWRSRELRKGA